MELYRLLKNWDELMLRSVHVIADRKKETVADQVTLYMKVTLRQAVHVVSS